MEQVCFYIENIDLDVWITLGRNNGKLREFSDPKNCYGLDCWTASKIPPTIVKQVLSKLK